MTIARFHMCWMPVNLIALSQELLLLVKQSDKPLPRADELNWSFSFLVELDRMLNWFWFTNKSLSASHWLQSHLLLEVQLFAF